MSNHQFMNQLHSLKLACLLNIFQYNKCNESLHLDLYVLFKSTENSEK